MTHDSNTLAPWTVRETIDNKTGKTVVKVRYHTVPIDLFADIAAAHKDWKAALEAFQAASSKLESVTLAHAKDWTVTYRGNEHPMIPAGYSGVVATRYGLAVGAVPAENKLVKGAKKATGDKAVASFGSNVKRNDAPELPKVLKRKA